MASFLSGGTYRLYESMFANKEVVVLEDVEKNEVLQKP
jgi:hypothetical protein